MHTDLVLSKHSKSRQFPDIVNRDFNKHC